MLNKRFKFLAILLTLSCWAPLSAAPITLVAGDGAHVPISRDAAQGSGLIRNMLSEGTGDTIHLPHVETVGALAFIATWLEYKAQRDPIGSAVHRHKCKSMSLDDLCTLLNAADYLGIPDLVSDCSLDVAYSVTQENYAQIEARLSPWIYPQVALHILEGEPPLKVEQPDRTYTLQRENVPGNSQRTYSGDAHNVLFSITSPDTERMAVVYPKKIEIWKLQNNNWILKTTIEKRDDRTLIKFSPDSRKLAIVQGKQLSYCSESSGWYVLPIWSQSPFHAAEILWVYDNTIALAHLDGEGVTLYEHIDVGWDCSARLGCGHDLHITWLNVYNVTMWLDSDNCLHIARTANGSLYDVRVWKLDTPERVAKRKHYLTIGQALSIKKKEAGPQI